MSPNSNTVSEKPARKKLERGFCDDFFRGKLIYK